MRQFNISNIIAYAVSIVTAGLGSLIVIRIIDFNIESIPRTIFGIVLILMGIYRFAITRMKAISLRQRKKMMDENE